MTKPPLWPAHLHHFCLDTPQIDAVVPWYETHLEMESEKLADGSIWLSGRQRNIIFRPAAEKSFGYVAYALADADQLARLDADLAAKDVARSDIRSPVFGDGLGGQVAIVDTDGKCFVFGLPVRAESDTPDHLPGRLQHLGICTTDMDSLIAFFTGMIGFRASDIVKNDNGGVSACFLRSDHEHHDLALFAASSSRFDHQCYETTCWNDIRDWGDHFAAQHTEIEWGAARHGAGNNLFIFVRDPDGNPVELSAELETRDSDAVPGEWKTEPRTLNLWGSAWTRD
jgi:catechol 2,3-dioxygenase